MPGTPSNGESRGERCSAEGSTGAGQPRGSMLSMEQLPRIVFGGLKGVATQKTIQWTLQAALLSKVASVTVNLQDV